MDSDNSRDDSSGNEAEGNGPQSPNSSRNQSPEISPSPSPQSGPRSPPSSPDSSQNTGSRSAFDPSSPFSRSDSRSRSRPRTPKSPDSASYDTRPKSPAGSPVSPSCSPTSEPKSPGPRSPSPGNSSHSSSNGPKSPDSVVDEKKFGTSFSLSPDRLSDTNQIDDKQKKTLNDDDDDGNSSDSSGVSIDSSSRKNKTISKDIVDTQAEEISDGDIESDHERDVEVENQEENNKNIVRGDINISHEDLSDVSDLDESIGGHSEDEPEINVSEKENSINDINKLENDTKTQAPIIEKSTNRTEQDGEEQLDFEAEDGECEIEVTKENEKDTGSLIEEGETIEPNEKEPEELEEGEVTDEDDVRPEETEPRPVCRFFSRGQCTWGASCRFLHPGVTDKGNYTMFEMIRPVVPGEYGRDERPYNTNRPEPAPVESAWERGLRTAKEMLRKSIKRKEQDIDFEEKKMNLSLAQEEFDKENGYYGRAPSPEPRYVRHVPIEYAPVPRPVHPPEEYYNHRQVIYEPDYVAPPPQPPRERVRTSYRELPSHRMPDYYNNKYEEEQSSNAAKVRKPKREVIVQRAEERPVRADEWSDPWMRSKSPAGRKSGSGGGGGGGSGRKRSYSSGSSYSSSSSSHSSSDSSHSTYRSRSVSSRPKRESRSHRSRHVSPSVIVSERKAANERAALMNPPAPKKRAPSPGMMRVNASNPPAPPREDQFGRTRNKLAVAAALAKVKGSSGRRRSSKSSSDSTGSSSSDSDSSGSSSSSSHDGSSPRRSSAMDVLKGNSTTTIAAAATIEKRQIKLNLKNPSNIRNKSEISDIARKAELLQGKKRPANSPPMDPKSKKATSRREELLKQLKAVEDAIAKKRSKVN